MNGQALKFLADESCDFAFVRMLRQNGYDVKAIVEVMPGVSDLKVLESGFEERRVLLTEDKDFGELVYRLKKPSRGIVLIRIDVKERHMKWTRLKNLIENHKDRLPKHFVVIDTQKFRFRPLLF